MRPFQFRNRGKNRWLLKWILWYDLADVNVWLALSAADQSAAKLWTDLYLAAFTHGHGLRLLTFDHGFNRLPEIEVLVLTN